MARAATAAGAATQTRVAVGSERSSRKTAFLDDRFVTVVKNDAEFDSQIGNLHFSRIGFCHVCKNDATYDIQVAREHFLFLTVAFPRCARTTLRMKSKSKKSISCPVALRARYYYLTGRGAIEKDAQSRLAFVDWSQIPGFS